MKRNILSVLIALASIGTACAQETQFLSSNHCLYRIQQKDKCLLLPVQESAEMSNIKVIAGNKQMKSLNVRLAMNKVCLLYTSPSPRDRTRSRMPSSA